METNRDNRDLEHAPKTTHTVADAAPDRPRRPGEPDERPPSEEEIAERLYNAYHEQGPTAWKQPDGQEAPSWASTREEIRTKWVAVVREFQNARTEVVHIGDEPAVRDTKHTTVHSKRDRNLDVSRRETTEAESKKSELEEFEGMTLEQMNEERRAEGLKDISVMASDPAKAELMREAREARMVRETQKTAHEEADKDKAHHKDDKGHHGKHRKH